MGSGLDNAANVSLPGKKKFSTSVQFDSERPLATSPQTLAGEEAISVDVAGSYLLTRNIALKAGVRYHGPANRLAPLTDERQDRSEEHTSELQSLMRISYAVFCLKNKKHKNIVKSTQMMNL